MFLFLFGDHGSRPVKFRLFENKVSLHFCEELIKIHVCNLYNYFRNIIKLSQTYFLKGVVFIIAWLPNHLTCVTVSKYDSGRGINRSQLNTGHKDIFDLDYLT